MTDAAEVAPDEPRSGGRRLPLPTGLSPRLLLLTILFALVAELLILAPSLASYHEARLLDRVRAAELASLAVEAAPEGGVSDALAAQLLNGAGVVSVAVQSGGVRRLLLEAPAIEAHARAGRPAEPQPGLLAGAALRHPGRGRRRQPAGARRAAPSATATSSRSSSPSRR